MSTALINVSELLTGDSSNSPLALKEVFGDSHLFETNAIFRAVREHVVEEGFTFATDSNEALWQTYQQMSLSCLEEIMLKKVFPCFPTRRTLDRLKNSGALDKPLPAQFLMLALTPNNHFHEAAHALGYKALEGSSLIKKLSRSEASAFIWGSIITEAVANTIELLAWVKTSTWTERLFLRLNAPSSYEDVDLRSFNSLVLERAGPLFWFSHVFTSFFVARLYPDVLAPSRQTDMMAAHSRNHTPPELERLAGILLRTAKGLRGEYREIVAPAYFTLLGRREAYDFVLSGGLCLSALEDELAQFATKCVGLLSLE